MSETSSLVTAEHFRYIADRTEREDRFLTDLKSAAVREGIPAIWIAPEQASFMQILLRLARAREVVEVGTLAGYSAITMARALPKDGRVRTIELEKKHADFAERWVARSDVAGRVQVFRGAGMDVLPKFAADSADAAFLDADKASYPLYLRDLVEVTRGYVDPPDVLNYRTIKVPRGGTNPATPGAHATVGAVCSSVRPLARSGGLRTPERARVPEGALDPRSARVLSGV